MKKSEERRLLNFFLRLRPDLLLAEICPAEPPDFLAEHAGTKVGIEMTRFYHEGSTLEPAIDTYLGQLQERLIQRHSAAGIDPLHISVSIARNRMLVRKVRRDELESALVDFVSSHAPSVDSYITFELEQLPQEMQALEVTAISIFRSKSLNEPIWTFPHGGWVQPPTRQMIQPIISEKAQKIASYQVHAPITWLLILSGTGGFASFFNANADILAASYPSPFARIFLFELFGPRVSELKTVSLTYDKIPRKRPNQADCSATSM